MHTNIATKSRVQHDLVPSLMRGTISAAGRMAKVKRVVSEGGEGIS